MSHHLDSPLARTDVRLDITDLYVFRGTLGTVFVLNVNNSIDGGDAPRGFAPEAQYAVSLDLDDDAVADLTYRATFGARDEAGEQTVQVRQLHGSDAMNPTAVDTLIGSGATNVAFSAVGGICLWAGEIADPFYIDATVLRAVGAAFKRGTRVDLAD